MIRSAGSSDVVVGLPDGPIDTTHPDLAEVRVILPTAVDRDRGATGPARRHGTFVAGVLMGRRGSATAGICPGCTLVAAPIFEDRSTDNGSVGPSATPALLAEAIGVCVDVQARVINVSAGFAAPSVNDERALEQVLTFAARRGVIVVAAAGNQGAVGTSSLTRHPAVIPVVACDTGGTVLRLSNLGRSIGRRGLSAPGDSIISLCPGGGVQTGSGTSVAAPFVTGALALLLSLFPDRPVQDVKAALLGAAVRRRTPVPPRLDAEAAYQALSMGGG